ncbi:hypothetical protein [Nocardia tengchongensis]|uniref:hypothetical protein n=1 Tax=Nocardia tengchongensis TaxID=2055889 RepID=UPI0036AEF3D5
MVVVVTYGMPNPDLVAALNDLRSTKPGDGAIDWPVLPDWHELSAAVSGHFGDSVDAHPVARWARALAEVQRAHRIAPDLPDYPFTRFAFVSEIDRWVLETAPCPAGVSESPGRTVEQIALAHLDVLAVVRAGSSEKAVRVAFEALTEHAVKWTGLVAEVVGGRPCARGGALDRGRQ